VTKGLRDNFTPSRGGGREKGLNVYRIKLLGKMTQGEGPGQVLFHPSSPYKQAGGEKKSGKMLGRRRLRVGSFHGNGKKGASENEDQGFLYQSANKTGERMHSKGLDRKERGEQESLRFTGEVLSLMMDQNGRGGITKGYGKNKGPKKKNKRGLI